MGNHFFGKRFKSYQSLCRLCSGPKMGQKRGLVPPSALVLFGVLNGQDFNTLFSQMAGNGIQMQNQQQPSNLGFGSFFGNQPSIPMGGQQQTQAASNPFASMFGGGQSAAASNPFASMFGGGAPSFGAPAQASTPVQSSPFNMGGSSPNNLFSSFGAPAAPVTAKPTTKAATTKKSSKGKKSKGKK